MPIRNKGKRVAVQCVFFKIRMRCGTFSVDRQHVAAEAGFKTARPAEGKVSSGIGVNKYYRVNNGIFPVGHIAEAISVYIHLLLQVLPCK